MKTLRIKTTRRKKFIQEKHRKKLEHLELDRRIQIEEKLLDADELKVLTLNPKLGVMNSQDNKAHEREIEVGLNKLRYKIRQIEEQIRQEEIEFENSDGKGLKIERKPYAEQIMIDAKKRQVFDTIQGV